MADTYQYPDARLIIFARAPIAGACNTRLAAELGEQVAADLQEELIRKRVSELTKAALCPIELWCSPDTSHALFQELAADHSIKLEQQMGTDLGQRMYHAMIAHEAKFSLIIGTDAPVMSSSHIKQAMQKLADGKDMVLIPAEDGGYVLLGLQRIRAALFQDIDWGSDQVCQQTLAIAEQLQLDHTTLASLWDIDHPADYWRYQAIKQVSA